MCPNHPDRPIKRRGLCGSCYEKYLKARDPEYAERQRENTRKWLAIPENRASADDRAVRYHKLNGNGKRARVKSKYGVSLEDYQVALSRICGICREKPSVHFDHDHKTGRPRGGLCHRCNIALGFYEGWFQEHKEAVMAWTHKGVVA